MARNKDAASEPTILLPRNGVPGLKVVSVCVPLRASEREATMLEILESITRGLLAQRHRAGFRVVGTSAGEAS
jgi:hypothetical protein